MGEIVRGKRPKANASCVPCLIELLPDDLLVHILSFLNLPDSVITSAISKRWRRLWTLLPSINFNTHSLYDYTDLCRYSEMRPKSQLPSYYKDTTVGEVITTVLSQHNDQVSLSSLSVDLTYMDFLAPYFDACIHFGINHNSIRELNFILDWAFNSYVLSPSLFQSCNFLTKLQLIGCAITLPDSSFYLSYLRSMHIGHCWLEEHVLRRLTSNACCPVLESLKLTACSGAMDSIPLVISLTNPSLSHLCLNDMGDFMPIVRAPHVKHLEFTGEWSYEGYVLENVSNLTEASIHFDDLLATSDYALPLLKSLFMSLPPIKLNVCFWVLKVLFISAIKTKGVAVPAVIKYLNLMNWPHFVNFFPTLCILFNSLGDIEHLKINLCPRDCNCIMYEGDMLFYEKDHNLQDEEYFVLLEQSLQFSNIRTIELDDFYWKHREEQTLGYKHRKWQFEFVRIMLAKLKNLEKLTIRYNSEQHGLSSRRVECLNLFRASPKAVVEFQCCL